MELFHIKLQITINSQLKKTLFLYSEKTACHGIFSLYNLVTFSLKVHIFIPLKALVNFEISMEFLCPLHVYHCSFEKQGYIVILGKVNG